MAATCRKEYDLDVIAQKLNSIKRSPQPDGNIAIHDVTAFTDLKMLIASAVKVAEHLPESVRRNVIYEATGAVIRRKDITAQDVLEEITQSITNYYKKPEAKYQLITSISANRGRRLSNARVAGCAVRFSGGVSKRCREARQTLLEDAKHSITGEFPKDYTLVKASVTARSELEAWENAINALDLVRAFWNLALNRGQYLRFSSGKRRPVNRFVLGPIHTLHKPTGDLATNNWWYQTDYQGPVSAHDPGNNNAPKMFRYANYARQCLKRSHYADHLIACLTRYVRALDTPDWEDSYLRLWGVLEQLTNTGVADNYKVTVRRASFQWKDRRYASQILTHLRDYRNNAVHSGTDNQDIETYIYQLKRYVEALLQFHMDNRFGFKTIAEAAEFMDLPDNNDELTKRIKVMKAARSFHSGR